MRAWTIRDSLELYNVPQLGPRLLRRERAGPPRGAAARRRTAPASTSSTLVEDLRQRGAPHAAAAALLGHPRGARAAARRAPSRGATAEYGYKGRFRGVYPIKVNQQRHVVEEIVALRRRVRDRARGRQQAGAADRARAPRHAGRADHLQRLQGPRLHRDGAPRAAPRPHADHRDRPLPRARPGDQGRRRARHPPAHRRARPALDEGRRQVDRVAPATARSSASRRAEIVEAVERLRAEDMLDCLELLHFHIGSQITAIRAIKDALREASRIFVGLHAARREADHPRRGRRARRRLRRLADELPLLEELLGAGVRERRGGRRSRRPATRRRAAPGHRHRGRALDGGPPLAAGVRRARRERGALGQEAARARRPRATRRCSATSPRSGRASRART